MRTPRLENILTHLEPRYRALDEHPVSAWALVSRENLCVFMETHVWAVWDFMSLLKALQRSLTSFEHPWRPARNPRAARLINEIVLGEESDLLADGSVTSHFELYLEAMQEVGANPTPVRTFVARFDASWRERLEELAPSPAAAGFVAQTLDFSRRSLPWVAGSFLLGRENLVPRLFRPLLREIEVQGFPCPRLRLYLERHIELDGDRHGPLSEQLIEEICLADESAWREVLASAEASLQARQNLWNAILGGSEARQVQPLP